MTELPRNADTHRQTQRTAAAVESKGCAPSHGLNVHARAASDKPSAVQMESQPKVTCFGLRRNPRGSGKEVPAWSKNGSAEKPAREVRNNKGFSEAKPATTCGARDILQTFGSDFLSEIFDSKAKERSGPRRDTSHQNTVCQNGEAHVPNADAKQAVDDTKAADKVEEVSVTPKIMASYESMSLPSQNDMEMDPANAPRLGDLRQSNGESSEEREREEGADSIAEGEEYDTFGTPKWTVDPHDIFFISRGDGSQKVCRLGKGDYGPVYLGVWQDQEVAVKLARQSPISLKNERQFQANIARLHSLNHPNIVPFLGACCWKGGKRSVLVSEFMDKSDLQMLLGRPDLAPKFAWREHGQTVALDIAHGLGYLHSQGLVHGRLKSTNVLMNKAGVAKISDVALPKLLSHCKTAPADISRWPEGAGDCDSMPGDIFAFGLILHELLTQETPTTTPLRAIRTPLEAPAKIAYLVECCLDADPAQRPTIDRVISIIGGKK